MEVHAYYNSNIHPHRKSIYIPHGFAHGFSVISDFAVVVYMQSTIYSSEHDRGIRRDSFGMKWGIENPIISQRDKSFPSYKDFESPFMYGENL